MSAMLSVSASAADRVATCIVDARLALAPGGLVLALQLARAGPVWLTRRFWALVDGAYFYRRYPEELVPRSADTKSDTKHADACGGDAVVEALMLWHTAWLACSTAPSSGSVMRAAKARFRSTGTAT